MAVTEAEKETAEAEPVMFVGVSRAPDLKCLEEARGRPIVLRDFSRKQAYEWISQLLLASRSSEDSERAIFSPVIVYLQPTSLVLGGDDIEALHSLGAFVVGDQAELEKLLASSVPGQELVGDSLSNSGSDDFWDQVKIPTEEVQATILSSALATWDLRHRHQLGFGGPEMGVTKEF